MTNPANTNRTFSTKLRRPIGDVNTTNTPAPGALPNPFGNSVQFTEVAYLDQLKQLSPPTVMVPYRFPVASQVASSGITIELWFKAVSSGSLVNLPMSPDSGTTTAIAPLIYIDSNGFLRAGLFDSTQITLLTPQQNLIASQATDGVITVGPVNALRSPLSVVDGQWHHAALVVQPGASGSQTLFLDGRLADTGTPNGGFGLSFGASDGTTWTAFGQSNTNVPLGGPITPQPVSVPSSYYYPPYAQGFCGCLTEVRIWNGPRIIPSIQSLMAIPASTNLTLYESEGLVGYVGSDQLQLSVQPGNYLSLVSDAPPIDLFTDVDNRIPGYQNYGLYTAIPFTTVEPEITFQPSQTYSTKISLCQADQLQVNFPTADSAGDTLNGTFSMTLTSGVLGVIQTVSQITPGTVYTLTAPAQDCYRFDLTYSTNTPCTINHLQFMLVPGPVNTLMQLLLDVVPLQAAYTDPNYPITPTTNIPDPRDPPGSGKTVTMDAYWPLFTDQTVFPIDPTKWSSNDLFSAYLNLNQKAGFDFFNLNAGGSNITDPSGLPQLLDDAYQAMVGNPPPTPVPTTDFATAIDQVYAFIYNVNTMRVTLYQFLNAYQGWAQTIIDTENLNLNATPGAIANRIYNDQQNVTLKGPSTGHFVLDLILGSAIIGLGAVCPLAAPALFAAETTALTVGTVALTAIGGAGANALSDFLGSFLGSSSAQLEPVSYSTLEQVANNVSVAVSAAYTNLLKTFNTPSYLQTLYSNYGLLQALSGVNAQPLSEANQAALLDPNNSLMTGITQASWKALIPSVFTWSPQLLTGQDFSGNEVVFQVTTGSALNPSYQSKPSELGIQDVLKSDPWGAFYWMLGNVQAWQTGNVQAWQTGKVSKPPSGQFFTICPIYFMWSSGLVGNGETTADWVIAWSLIDANNNAINPDLVAGLFGLGTSTPLSLADQNNPFAAAGYGWYCATATAPGAVTTPFDAFMNWGEGLPSYSPQILIAQMFEGSLFDATKELLDVQFAAAAAADTPPEALVTLEPSVVNLGSVPVGTEAKLSAVLTNNQQNTLQNINYFLFGGNSANSMPDLPPGGFETINLSFSNNTVGPLSETVTFTAQGQYGPIALTLKITGTVVATSQSLAQIA